MPNSAYAQFLQQRHKEGQWRKLNPTGPTRKGYTSHHQRSMLNFSSNNYLGLANHPVLIERAMAWTQQWGTGSTASRLVCGNLELFDLVESRLARGKNTASALVFNSGFQANATILAALLDRSILKSTPLVYCDRLNHASLHHGCLVAGVKQIRYRHNDLNHLESLLHQQEHLPGPRFIITESVFGMDGDQCDLEGLLTLKHRFGAFLYLDEAHATGVLGPKGFGLGAAHPGEVDLIMGTFSKGLGSFGAYAGCSLAIRDFLINRCSGLIYSTALPPGILGAMEAALTMLPDLDQTRCDLLDNAATLRHQLQQTGLNTGHSTTQIIPIILGSETDTLTMSRMLAAEGILAIAIRPPTVPRGTARLRLSLTADHEQPELDRLNRCLAEILPRLNSTPSDTLLCL